MTLSEIIERLEKATGPNYQIEVDIFKLVHTEYADYVKGRGGLVHRNDGSDQRVLSDVRPPNYTASVDAAIALAEKVLPGEPVNMGWAQTPETRPWARVGAWSAPDATGPTPALALVTAVLSALRAKQEGNQP